MIVIKDPKSCVMALIDSWIYNPTARALYRVPTLVSPFIDVCPLQLETSVTHVRNGN
jgi:hypothetical protein